MIEGVLTLEFFSLLVVVKNFLDEFKDLFSCIFYKWIYNFFSFACLR